jgi:hypothetical protein
MFFCVCASIKRYIGILYISRWSRKSLSCIDGGGGGGCLNETIFGQVQATTINGYNCLHAVWDTSYFLCVCDRAADAARGISNSCHGCSILRRAAAGSYSSLWHILSKEINVPSARLIENRHCKSVCSILCTPCKYAYKEAASAKMPTCKKSAQAVRTPSVICAPPPQHKMQPTLNNNYFLCAAAPLSYLKVCAQGGEV